MIGPATIKRLLGNLRENDNLHLAGDTPESVEKTKEGNIVSIYRPEPPKELRDTLVEAMSRNDLSDRWRNEIAARETREKPYDGYGVQTKSRVWNKKLQRYEDLYAYGRYQMTPDALKDAGMMRPDGTWSGKYGISSAVEFLNNPQAQEAALKDLTSAFEGYVAKNGRRAVIGKSIDGVKEKIAITESGLVAAIHREGIGRVDEYFDWLKRNGWNSRGNQDTMTDKFRHIETRLREFQQVPYK